MKEVYIYPAIFHYEDNSISISFPDLPGCFSCADTDEEAIINAKDVLSLHINTLEEDRDIIPPPTPLTQIQTEHNQVVVPIEVWMPYYRSQIKTVYVKKTLTIPNWLDALGKLNNVNFSQVLQEALKEKLGVTER